MPLSIGSHLGHFEIVALIGAGGMGEVYRARDPRLGRDVAIKVLPDIVAGDPERLERFEREARAVAALSHPNILSIFDFGADHGVSYAVMELLEGETLRDRLKTGPLSPRRAVEYGTQIAHGLAAAHEKGLIHRDLKPENVFVSADGHVKILDFGLARTAAVSGASGSDETSLGTRLSTTPGLVVGTIGYMAPEQVRGEAVDARSDIFAFGALMYELLTGERAFKGATPADTMSSILKDEPSEPKTRDGALPPQLERVVLRCLEKAPARRFQSAHDLAFALEHALGSTSGASVAAAPREVVAGPAGRRSGLLPIAAVGLVALATGLGIDRWLQPAPAPPLQPTFTALTNDSGIEEWPSLSPDGSSFVYAKLVGAHEDIFLRRVDGRNVNNLTADSGADNTMPAYSPDSKHIAFCSTRSGGGVFIMEATGENVKRVAPQGFNPAWSPDSTRLAYVSEATATPMARSGNSQLWIVDVSGGQPRKVVEADAMQPAWSPDGTRLVAWSVEGGQRLLKVFVADSGESSPVFASDRAVTNWSPVWTPDGAFIYFASNKAGAMTLARVPVDARGHATGPQQTIVTPAAWTGQITMSHDGRHIAYQSLTLRNELARAAFDPVRGAVSEPPTAILAGALGVSFPSVSPDGKTIAFSNSGGLAGIEDIYSIDRDGSHLRQLTDSVGRNRGPSWSPDGSRIFFYSSRSGRYQIWSMNPDGSDLRTVASIADDDLMFPRFSGEGRMSVAGLKTSALFDTSTPAKLIEKLPTTDSSGGLMWPLAWSPDHSALLGIPQSNTKGVQPDVLVYRLATHTFERLAGLGTGFAWLPDGKRVLSVTDRYYVVDLATRTRTPLSSLPAPGPFAVAGLNATLGDSGRTLYVVTQTRDADIWMMTLGPGR